MLGNVSFWRGWGNALICFTLKQHLFFITKNELSIIKLLLQKDSQILFISNSNLLKNWRNIPIAFNWDHIYTVEIQAYHLYGLRCHHRAEKSAVVAHFVAMCIVHKYNEHIIANVLWISIVQKMSAVANHCISVLCTGLHLP